MVRMDAYDETLTYKDRFVFVFGIFLAIPIAVVVKTRNPPEGLGIVVYHISRHASACLLREKGDQFKFTIFKVLENG